MSLSESLLKTPLHELHLSLGARMVPFAGYSMPVQYPSGLMAEHLHTRASAGLFDVSHMGQLRLVGPDAGAAFETLMPVDVIDLSVGKQRYGLLLNDDGGIIDDLMFFKRETDIFVIVNGACKAGDIAHIQSKIGHRCQVIPMPQMALMALQGPKAVDALKRLCPGIEKLVFMTGGTFNIASDSHGPHQTIECFVTRSGYTGEDGFEISVHEMKAEALAHALLAQPEVKPMGLGARNSLRLEAGLCLYGQDIDATTTPVEAGLNWAIQKVRRSGGARAGLSNLLMAAFSAPKRNFKKAVTRNLLKRRMRESWRIHNGQLKTLLKEKKRNLVVSVRYKAREVFDYQTVEKEMVDLIKFLESKI